MSQLSWHDTIPYRIAKFCVYYAKQFNEGTLCFLYHETILTNAIFFSDLRCLILMMQHRELHD